MNYLKRLVQTIKKNRRIVVATHIDPDADGIAAALSCAHLVKHYKRRVPILFCYSPIPSKYRFLLKRWRFVRKLPDFDLLIAVDSAGISRIFPDTGGFDAVRPESKVIINIDHHKSNDAFGMLKIIKEDASSACEIIYDIFKKLRVRIDKSLAEIFYCGIYSETGGFVYPNTTKESLRIASELVELGVKPGPLVKKLNAKTLNGTKLLSKVLDTIEIKNGVGVMYVTQSMLKKSRAKMTESENFVSFLQAITEVKVSLFLREEHRCTRISLRSDGVLDVDKLANRYGGGGHRLAAGARIKKPLKVVKKEIVRAILREMKKKR
ncbi:MAG TPA: bifunctional oligoribonuclease/PAP phosphatase NrnA [candidate division WOR-3 bacterium]|uniref:Bifunctional oligoribonuclease/PAP phosphatase NrnA n=1 Tax=candidate division WOR-3 bacterium TaxID=2052148 RepID=A0A9C9EN89_UNCW3|nr:bifunctional oligoribonuclease/PAP phosphatase NrnA [candidate division WOR-3 bacterium]